MAVSRRVQDEPLTLEQQRLVEENQGLVGWTIGRYFKSMLPHEEEDARQDGMIGLCAAARKFDPSKGFRFATYAPNWIRQAIQRGRGDFEGINYRRAVLEGKVADFRQPVPILAFAASDAHSSARSGRTGGAGTVAIAETISEPSCAEDDAVFSAWASSLLGLCMNDIERAWLESVLADPSLKHCERESMVADQMGVAWRTVQDARLALRRRLRKELAAV